MSDRRFTAIVNPAAGGGRCGRHADRALRDLERRGVEFDVHRTQKAGDATEITRRAWERGARRFLAIGGDGTSFEIVNGIPFGDHATERATLAMLPLGTGNSFLRDFAIDNAETAMDAIARSSERACDVIRIEHDSGVLFAINLVGVGFSAEVGALTNRKYKALGAAGYILAVFETIAKLHFPSFPLRLDGSDFDRRPTILLSFCNSRCTAGTMKMAPRADIADGKLDVIRIGPRGKLELALTFPSIFVGKHVERPGVEEARATEVEFDVKTPIECMIDGEVIPLTLRKIGVIPSALRVVA